jgi:hypothetical protein
MFTISQTVGHPLKQALECVWSLSGEKLTCVWVAKSFQAAAVESPQEKKPDLSQRVA